MKQPGDDMAPRPWLGRTSPKSDGDESLSIYLRWAGAVVMAMHGLVHLMGMQLLWKLGEPAQLSYAAAVPTPGTAAAYAVGALWLAAAVLFVLAALLAVMRRVAWRFVAIAAVLVSGGVIGLAPGQARAGLVFDALVLVAVAWSAWREHRHHHPGTRQPA